MREHLRHCATVIPNGPPALVILSEAAETTEAQPRRNKNRFMRAFADARLPGRRSLGFLTRLFRSSLLTLNGRVRNDNRECARAPNSPARRTGLGSYVEELKLRLGR